MRRWIPYDDWCSRQDSNLYCTDSHSVSSTRIGILELMERHPGFEPEPSVWKTDMLGRYTNATHAGSLLSREHLLTSRHH